jgi:PKD repeat protein
MRLGRVAYPHDRRRAEGGARSIAKWNRVAVLALVAAAASVALASDAHAVITEPIPSEGPAVPPIPALPSGGDTAPPVEVISDPVEPAATCGGWFRQSNYAGKWPTQSSWWEYECTLDYVIYPACGDQPGACDAGYWIIGSWTDRYYWDGWQTVFLGENSQIGCDDWWDAPTGQWYLQPNCPARGGTSNDGTTANAAPTAAFTHTCVGVTCSFEASASADSDGTIQAYSWSFGDGSNASGSGAATVHTYPQAGSYPVTLTVTDNGGAMGTVSKDVLVTNAAPSAAFAVSCTGLTCGVDAGASSDSDGTIAGYGWSFGDGTTGIGRTTGHSYPRAGSYIVTLTVTDNAGDTATMSQRINPISLSARGYKRSGLQKVDLSWTGTSGTSFDLYRSGLKIATVQTTTYTDNINVKGSGSYTYQVCEAGNATCSNEETVSF